MKKNEEIYANAIGEAREHDEGEFLNWFNNNENEKAVLSTGFRDFFSQVLSLDTFRLLPGYDKCLEIGIGGGRLAAAAGTIFEEVYGVDVHDDLGSTEKWLEENTKAKVVTKQLTDPKIPFDPGFDFIYSYIVLQHVMKISIIDQYIGETSRLLSEQGVAVLFFGRYRFIGRKIPNHVGLFLDYIIENA